MLPYRNLPVARFEELMDAELAGEGARPPPTASFLDCLKQAVLRRGLPLKLYTDQGKPFVGTHARIVCARHAGLTANRLKWAGKA
jgi:hypothetical protein